MSRFPEPPPAGGLGARLEAQEWLLPGGSLLWRIYSRGGDYPLTWSEFRSWGPRPGARFDHHVLPPGIQGRRILYAALQHFTCFAEVFQSDRTIDRFARRRWLVGFETLRPIRLLDMTGPWPTRAGASMELMSGRRDRARRWSLRIYEDYPQIEGLLYASSMSGQRATALYERAEAAMPRTPTFHRSLADPDLDGLVARAADMFGYRAVSTRPA